MVEWSIFTMSRVRVCACAFLNNYVLTVMVIKPVACLSVTLLDLTYYPRIDSLRLSGVCGVGTVTMNLSNVK